MQKEGGEPFRGVILGEGIQHRLDLRGAIIPFSLLKVSQVLKIIKPGELLEILCSDPDIKKDLFKILPHYSCELTLMKELEDFNSLISEDFTDLELWLSLKFYKAGVKLNKAYITELENKLKSLIDICEDVAEETGNRDLSMALKEINGE